MLLYLSHFVETQSGELQKMHGHFFRLGQLSLDLVSGLSYDFGALRCVFDEFWPAMKARTSLESLFFCYRWVLCFGWFVAAIAAEARFFRAADSFMLTIISSC